MDYTQGSILRALAGKLGDWRGDNNDTSHVAASIAEGTGSELHLVHVVGTGGTDPRVYEQMRRSSLAFLDEQAGKLRAAGAMVAKAHPRNWRPDQEIVALDE